MSAATEYTLMPAWTDGVHAAQATFRTVLKALSEPALIQTIPDAIDGPAPLYPSTIAVCLALLDPETPVWCDDRAQSHAAASYLRFHCGCPMSQHPTAAAFALISNLDALDFGQFAHGTMEYPDRSTTLLIQVPSLVDGPVRAVSGPGIAEPRMLRVGGLPDDFNARWGENVSAFPLGVDILFCCGSDIVGLPRTTRIHDQEHSPCM
jgi:alpha-D-ribose 1-methylphosphonate 5-triphosphate synthase subunit PhnH